jgi:hypothetical protein
MPLFVTNQNCGSKFALIMILDFSILCGIYFTRNVFGITCKEKRRNLWRLKVELTKHRESFPRELLGDQYFQCFYSFFFHCEKRGIVVFPYCQKKQTISCLHRGNSSSSWSMVPQGILKKFLNAGFSSPILRPCCAPTTTTSGCAYVDSNNQPLYTLCNNPSQSFFWDSFHPTQAGWSKIYNLLLTSSTYTGGRSLECFLLPQLCQWLSC